ncbi:Ubiquitin carboxyl-terminal hydrolase 36 [Frankliniella fusca]|uniref:Ubiquitin carboxyl-terminal hydrolase 36 n=1 Tax=Frankliniella fusca TaxID=407009 RepID=A0AAE1HMZ2_9NEOP|nr:Ubiquitin carboxyl-terminal hydrolase 36 [Frankliniella fusca]
MGDSFSGMTSPNKKWRNDMPPMPPAVTLYEQFSLNEWNPKVPHRDVDIFNFGNTCFINACLQILYHTPNIIKWLETSNHPSACTKFLHCCTSLLLKTWRQYKCSKVPLIRPAAFVAVIRSIFRTPDENMDDEGFHADGNKQEDAHEFLLFLLQNLEDDFLSPFVFVHPASTLPILTLLSQAYL